MRRSTLRAVLVVLAVLSPLATAHEGQGPEFEDVRETGPYRVLFRIPGSFVLAGVGVDIGIEVTPAGADAVPVENVTLTLTDPAGNRHPVPLEWVANQSVWGAGAQFSGTGAWIADVTLMPSGDGAQFEVPVYKRSKWALGGRNAASFGGELFVIGEPVTLRWAVIDAVNNSIPSEGPATMRIDGWSTGHETLLSRHEFDLEPLGRGRYELPFTFNTTGMFHIHFASPTFELGYPDRPHREIQVLTPEEARAAGVEFRDPNAVRNAWLGVAAVAAVIAAVLGVQRLRGGKKR